MTLNIKKLIHTFILGNVLLFLSLTNVSISQAQGANIASSSSSNLALSDEVDFALLGYEGGNLYGPSDSERIFFSTPADWELTESAQLHLDIVAFLGSSGAGDNDGTFGGSLAIVFNEVLLDTVLLQQNGPQTISIPIPRAALVSVRDDGRHQLSISLDSAHDCNGDQNTQNTIVVINKSSRFLLPHRVVAPPTDLTQLPRPIFQRSFVPDEAIIVIPDEPSTAAMQAALTVAAGLGQMTNGQLTLSLQPVSDLTTEMQSDSHLIVVSQFDDVSWLDEVSLPIASGEDLLKIAGADVEDGVMQMVASPWNEAKVVLVISGHTETAVLKAAQALSAGPIRTGSQPNIALVSIVNAESTTATSTSPDMTFAELGYSLQTLDNIGSNKSEYEFLVPQGQVVGQDAALNLVINHSALLDYAQSGLTVRLNEELIGSARFTEETAALHMMSIAIPGTAVHAGVNRLSLEAELVPLTQCGDLRQDSTWLTVRPESNLHLPLSLGQAQVMDLLFLNQYPKPFVFDPTLSQTAFVLSANDPAAWNAAVQIASDLGSKRTGSIADFLVSYGNDLPEAMRQERDLLVIGRPNRLLITAEFGDALPVPFDPKTGRMIEDGLPTTYHQPLNRSLGYLELLSAPWDNERVILLVAGSSAEGLETAVKALVRGSLRTQLTGNVAIVDDQQLFVTFTQASNNSVDSGLASDISAQSDSANDVVYRPAWILPAIIGSVSLIVIIALGVFIQARRRKYAHIETS